MQAIVGRNATDAELILNAVLVGGVLIVLALAVFFVSWVVTGWLLPDPKKIVRKGKPK